MDQQADVDASSPHSKQATNNGPVASLAASRPAGSVPDASGGAIRDRSGPASAKLSFPPPAAVPTQAGPRGLRFDFNLGARVAVPDGAWRVTLRDLDTGNILFDQETSGALVNSSKRYFVRFRIEVFEAGEKIFAHDFSARDQNVLILFPVGTLGDVIAWFASAPRFAEHHCCRLTCAMSARLIPLFRDAYPDITFITPEAIEPERYYATYRMGLFFDDEANIWQPCDFRLVGLHRTASYILGIEPCEAPPRVVAAEGGRPIPEPYVCIAVQATTQAKKWNNPSGWRSVIKHCQARGYRVICIDQKPVHGQGHVWTHLPHGAEDQTGDRPLTERVLWLLHAEFFVGLGSGLSWLAWAAGTPVVMISGFSHPTTEFATPHRVINYHTCNSCWNDPRERFEHKDFLWCPRHKDTPRQFECTRLVTAEQVIAKIERVRSSMQT